MTRTHAFLLFLSMIMLLVFCVGRAIRIYMVDRKRAHPITKETLFRAIAENLPMIMKEIGKANR